MNKFTFYLRNTMILVLCNLLYLHIVLAQTPADAANYLNKMGEEHKKITKDMWDYTSAVGHGKSAKKVEKRRKELLNTLLTSTKNIKKMKDYEGDPTYKDAVLKYLEIDYNVLNNDYAKIVDLEEIAEQSYDLMEAYMLAQEKANEKVQEAGEELMDKQKAFAASNNVTLNVTDDKITKKMKIAGEIFKYKRIIYLIFFKNYKQEVYLLSAIMNKDVNAIEQNNNSLLKYSQEGIGKLKSIKSFKGDVSLVKACRAMLDFYKSEAEVHVASFIDFYLKNDNFEKIKSAFDAKKQSQRTKEDVNQFNKAVNEINEASVGYNATNQKLNEQRNILINNWNNSQSIFLDKHTPKNR